MYQLTGCISGCKRTNKGVNCGNIYSWPGFRQNIVLLGQTNSLFLCK
jgi:hypothetical protein